MYDSIKVSFILPNNSDNFLYDLIAPCEKLGLKIYVNDCKSDADFIIGWSISQLSRICGYHLDYKNIPLINYNWDVYEWVWKEKTPYDWNGYGEILRKSFEVWVPSFCTAIRTLEYWKIINSYRIKTCTRLPQYRDISDKRFILNPLRNIPDRQKGWFEQICKELGIPYLSTDIKLEKDEYLQKMSECSFIICPWYEASTGGQGLMEGYYLGKPVVVCDSPYMGTLDYFGNRAIYYKPTYESMKEVIKNTWNNTPILDRENCKKYALENFIPEIMAKEIAARLRYLKYEK